MRLAGKLRALKGQDIEEGVSTRLLVYCASLIHDGMPIERAVRAALIEPLSDDADVKRGCSILSRPSTDKATRMSALEFEPWEPEESVGKLWHSFVSKLERPGEFQDAAATLYETRGRLGILFRGLGGARDVEIKAATAEPSLHRMSWRRSLGQSAERLELASFDGEVLRLPARLAVFGDHGANVALYVWLTACAIFASPPSAESDPLRADIRALQAVQNMTRATLGQCPGLRRMHAALVMKTREAARRSQPAGVRGRRRSGDPAFARRATARCSPCHRHCGSDPR